MGKIYMMSHGVQTPLGLGLLSESISKDALEGKKWLVILSDNYFMADRVEAGLQKLGVCKENVTVYLPEKREQIVSEKFDYIYVAEGNTFEVLYYVKTQNLVLWIQNQFQLGADYVGASAGAHLAGVDISTAAGFDKDYRKTADLTALGLFPGVVIPHYESTEVARYLAYKEAKMSKKYENVYTVGDGEILIV